MDWLLHHYRFITTYSRALLPLVPITSISLLIITSIAAYYFHIWCYITTSLLLNYDLNVPYFPLLPLSHRLLHHYCVITASLLHTHLEPCQTRYRGFSRYRVTHWHDIGSYVPISGFSFDPISGHVACDPISGTYIGYLPDIGSSCHRYRKPHTWYRDQYRVQYQVSRYRWHDIPISVSISGTSIGCPDIGVW